MTIDAHEDRRIRKTRQALQEAFVSLVLEKGYEAVTVMDVAERADYNRGTFYNHYDGKEELLREIHDEFLKGFTDVLLEPYQGMEGVEARSIYPSALLLFQHIEKRMEAFKALLSVDKKLALEMVDALRESMRRDMHIEMEPTDPPIDYEFMLSYRMSATVGVILYWAETNFKYSADYMAKQLLMQVNSRIEYIEFRGQEG